MDSKPLVYFTIISSEETICNYAEYDSSINIPYVGVYHFDKIPLEASTMRTIWYVFFDKSYYACEISLKDTAVKDMGNSYMELCYIPYGVLYIWIANEQKSITFQLLNNKKLDNISFIGEQQNNEWVKIQSSIQRKTDKAGFENKYKAILVKKFTQSLMQRFAYRYQIQLEAENKAALKFDYIEEALFDGTHDKLHDGGLMKYHEAGKPKKLKVHFHVGGETKDGKKRSVQEYSAYFWFEDERIREVFDKFYGAHPDTKTDFIIKIDAEKNKYQVALYRYGLKEPTVLSDDVYQLIVFRNKFECYRSKNYNQQRGAWIW